MVSVHNPDQYMWNLRQVIAQGRKRIGFLIGAGAPAGVKLISGEPLIPAIKELTATVLGGLDEKYELVLAAIVKDLKTEAPNIEHILSRIRAVGRIMGSSKLHGLTGDEYEELGKLICKGIGAAVSKDLPVGQNAYAELVSWISGTDRRSAVEIFTTNYDLLFEQAFERARQPYFDGFVGSSAPFFDSSSVSNNDLPARWARLWKLHGSLGWELDENGDVTRTAKSSQPYCVFPEHMKYEQTQKAPYSALFDRLGAFLCEPDTMLISCGFSFADTHITARIMECLVANPAATVFAFQFGNLDDEPAARALGLKRANVSVYGRDRAVVNGIEAPWRTGEPPSKNWGVIQATYWLRGAAGGTGEFLLGDFGKFAPFFASSKAEQGSLPIAPAVVADNNQETISDASIEAA